MLPSPGFSSDNHITQPRQTFFPQTFNGPPTGDLPKVPASRPIKEQRRRRPSTSDRKSLGVQYIGKGNIVDLTIDNDGDEEEITGPLRKKSRSSSQSTELSDEIRTRKPTGKILRPVPASKKSAEKVSSSLAVRSSSKSIQYPPVSKNEESRTVGSISLPSVVHDDAVASVSKKSVEKSVRPLSNGSSIRPGHIASAVVVPPPQPSPEEARRIFFENIRTLNGVTLWNSIDGDSPPTDFRFIENSLIGAGVTKASENYMSGCNCRKDNGRQIGCEYLSCECLQDSATNDEGRHVFPYSASKSDFGCLRNFYLENRHHIYECNKLCNCESNCKNRVVQHGRTVLVQIFKTVNRGWGLRCLQDLKKGQFIDTYRGEIITHEEANRRGSQRNANQDIYLMDLDKWTEEEGSAIYAVDGMHLGGPTRFINHSCEPNCAIYTVSYNHADVSIYEIAFFTTEFVPRGTELTFDYAEGEETAPISDERADELEKERGYRPKKCLCGAEGCRRYFFS